MRCSVAKRRRRLVIEDHPACRTRRAPVHQQRGQSRIVEELVRVMARPQPGQDGRVDRAAAQQPQVALAQLALVRRGPQQQAALRCDLLGAGDDGHHEGVACRDQQADRRRRALGPARERGSWADSAAQWRPRGRAGESPSRTRSEGSSLRTLETTARSTPARWATSAMVARPVPFSAALRPPWFTGTGCAPRGHLVNRLTRPARSVYRRAGERCPANRSRGLRGVRCRTCGSVSWASSGATGPT